MPVTLASEPAAPLLAFASQSGNVAKTSLAAATAIALAREGAKVLAIDLEHEHRLTGSLLKWHALRAHYHPGRITFDIEAPDDTASARRLIERDAAGYDAVILDCPSRATKATAAIAGMVHLMVLPFTPTGKDNDITLETAHALTAAQVPLERLAVALTRCRTKAGARDYHATITSTPVDTETHTPHYVFALDEAIFEKEGYTLAMNTGLALIEAKSLPLRRQASRLIDGLLARWDLMRQIPIDANRDLAGGFTALEDYLDGKSGVGDIHQQGARP